MKWLGTVLSLFCAFSVRAETVTLDTLGVEPQERTHWCWAAVSVMSIRAFPVAGDFHHLSQLEVVARRRANVTTLVQAAVAANDEEIKRQMKKCAKKTKCNSGNQPLLFDIDSDPAGTGFALPMQAFRADIKAQHHPVVIRWTYDVPAAQAGSTNRSGEHALIVTGYNDTDDEVRVFDPLPVNSTVLSDHEKWIPYDVYVNPLNDEGAAALHESDQYRMRRAGSVPPDAQAYGSLVSIGAMPISAPDIGDFVPLQSLDGAIRDFMHGHVFRDRDGTARQGDLKPGDAFPIVAIGTADLLRNGDHPESLLVARTGAYVVPVLQANKVVDSFLVLNRHGRWMPGGYSNNRIASLVYRMRSERSGQGREAQGFYLVSMPEIGTFFLAHGSEHRADLISLDNDGRGDFTSGRGALRSVIRVLRNAEADASARPGKLNAAH